VADVERPGRHADALGDRVARGQDQVVAAQVEAADGGREQREILAIAALRVRGALDEGGPDGPTLDGRRYRARHVEQGVDRGLGEQLSEDLDASFASPHPGEPV